MIYRFIAVTSKRDFARSAIDRFFQDYLIFEADNYKDNVKRRTLVIEVVGKTDGSDVEFAYKTANELAKVLGVSVSLQIQDIKTMTATFAEPIKESEPSKPTIKEPVSSEKK